MTASADTASSHSGMAENDIAVGIGELSGLDLAALRDHWVRLYGDEPPVRMSRELMIQAIAYRLQERVHCGLSRATRQKLAAASKEAGNDCVGGPANATVRRSIKPGTRFLREWQGRTHEVIAIPESRFSYRGRTFQSLSAIAREITGTRWSGPAFFGLDQQMKRSRNGKVTRKKP